MSLRSGPVSAEVPCRQTLPTDLHRPLLTLVDAESTYTDIGGACRQRSAHVGGPPTCADMCRLCLTLQNPVFRPLNTSMRGPEASSSSYIPYEDRVPLGHNWIHLSG